MVLLSAVSNFGRSEAHRGGWALHWCGRWQKGGAAALRSGALRSAGQRAALLRRRTRALLTKKARHSAWRAGRALGAWASGVRQGAGRTSLWYCNNFALRGESSC